MNNYLFRNTHHHELTGVVSKHCSNAIPLHIIRNHLNDRMVCSSANYIPDYWFLLAQISDEDVILLTLLGAKLTKLPDDAHIYKIDPIRTHMYKIEYRIYCNISESYE